MIKPALALAALLLFAACAAETPAKDAGVDLAAMEHSGHDLEAATPAAGLTEAQMANKAANDRMHKAMATIPADADVAFMRGMLAHHKGAVEMSEVALKHAKEAEVRDLAARVIAAQKQEIAEMEAWLKARGVQ